MKNYLRNLLISTSFFIITPRVALAQDGTGRPSLNELVIQAGQAIYVIINWTAIIAGAVIVGMIVWGGLQYIQGDAEGGKKTLLAAIIGAVIVLLAKAMLETFKNITGS